MVPPSADAHATIARPSCADSPVSVESNPCRRRLQRVKSESPESMTTLPMSNNMLGTLVVALPAGEVLQVREECVGVLEAFIRPGENILDKLDGKGGQLLTMQAFCSTPRPRMFARLKGEDKNLCCSFVCNFSPDPANRALRVASIEVYGIDFVASGPCRRVEFTTRHNSSCSLIYIDASSVPFLGHFPSEKTGTSLFSIVHADDACLLEAVHRRLRAGHTLARSRGLRFIAHDGRVCRVDSEWAAFTSPWSQHVEMVVGRHAVVGLESADAPEPLLVPDKCRLQEATVRTLLENTEDYVPKETFIDAPPLTKSAAQQSPDLSYNQINCLENVHRLLKSQSPLDNRPTAAQLAAARAAPLTREMLHRHDRRWEAACKGSWHRRLQQKRGADDFVDEGVSAKRARAQPAPAAPVQPSPALLQYLNAVLGAPVLQHQQPLQQLQPNQQSRKAPSTASPLLQSLLGHRPLAASPLVLGHQPHF